MSVVSEIIARLSPETGGVFAIVEGAGGWAAVSDSVPTAMPAAYVVSLREASDKNERITGRVLQHLEADIAVILVTDNVSDAIGGAAAGDIEALKAWVRGRLLGFTPASAADPLVHVSGELLKTKNGVVWHEEVYGASTYLEELP
ncbi:MAG: hypothetical protein ABIF45_17400 [Pseudomonadota bacterium]